MLIINNSFCFASSDDDIDGETKKPVGHKIYNAEYFEYDPSSDKFRIIIAEGEGGSGEGGGSSGGGTSNVSGSGSINGTGVTAGGSSGAGNNNSVGSNGSGTGSAGVSFNKQNSNAVAEALRKSIAESRIESIAAELETAVDASKVQASITERESIQESIENRVRQESINARLNAERNNVDINQTVTTIAPMEFPFIEETYNNVPVTIEVKNESPTVNISVEGVEETTLKVYDMPIVETAPVETVEVSETTNEVVEESTVVATEEPKIKPTEEIKESKESEEVNNQEDHNTGDKGGNQKETAINAEGNQDDTGEGALGSENPLSENSQLEKGILNGHETGDSVGAHKNMKVFELNTNGGLGFKNEGKGKNILSNIIYMVIFMLVMVGEVYYFLPFLIKIKKKRSYF